MDTSTVVLQNLKGLQISNFVCWYGIW